MNTTRRRLHAHFGILPVLLALTCPTFVQSNTPIIQPGAPGQPARELTADVENCVAHNGSIVPVPGRDIFVQAWYQGGISMIDFTNSANPTEIAYFDRGPIDAEDLILGGFWSSYYYNGEYTPQKSHVAWMYFPCCPASM